MSQTKEQRKAKNTRKAARQRARRASDPAFKKREQAQSKAWRQANPDYVRSRILKKHGINTPDFNHMADAQGFVCMICGWVIEDTDGKAKTLHVDHNHTTKQVRGLLCESCNLGLGKFKDQADLLRKAAAYLDHFTFIERTENY